jgi:hypothetical protein
VWTCSTLLKVVPTFFPPSVPPFFFLSSPACLSSLPPLVFFFFFLFFFFFSRSLPAKTRIWKSKWVAWLGSFRSSDLLDQTPPPSSVSFSFSLFKTFYVLCLVATAFSHVVHVSHPLFFSFFFLTHSFLLSRNQHTFLLHFFLLLTSCSREEKAADQVGRPSGAAWEKEKRGKKKKKKKKKGKKDSFVGETKEMDA